MVKDGELFFMNTKLARKGNSLNLVARGECGQSERSDQCVVVNMSG